MPELPFQAESCFDRLQYVAKVNNLKTTFDVDYADKANWEEEVWGIPGDRMEVLEDASRGSKLTVHYYDSVDGVCRTAFASVDNQIHEYRQHSGETAWKFISQFTR